MKPTKHAAAIGLGMLCLMVPGALRADTIPISGTISANNLLVLTTPPNIFSGTSTGTGVDATFGAFTFSSAWTTTLTDPTDFLVSNGTFVDAYAGGTLTGSITGSGTVNTSTLVTTFTENLAFTSGTGIFAGDTGLATLSGTGTFALSGPSTASYTGTFTTPEPSTLVLLSVSLLTLMGMGLYKSRHTRRSDRKEITPALLRSASGELFALLTKTYHGSRLTGNWAGLRIRHVRR